jgi:DNA-directed RNA polymerase subunit RPC12/RpoP
MMNKLSKKQDEYSINLATVDGDGAFKCPKCGMSISPEDETEDNYKILDTKVLNDELVELVIACEKCGSKIVLTGFQTINA